MRRTPALAALLAILPFLGGFDRLAQANELGEGMHAYGDRPRIEDAAPVPRESELGKLWPRRRQAMLEPLAMLFEVYRGREIYFLARDAESLHDLAVLLSSQDPALRARLHLLNLSRKSVQDANVKEYLRGQGISNASMQGGLRPLIVDSGRRGSIEMALAQLYPKNGHRIQTHLMVSTNPAFPSCRSFVVALDDRASLVQPALSFEEVTKFEVRIPHFTQSSVGFAKVGADERWDAVWSEQQSSPGKVSKVLATKVMEDLAHFAGQDSTREYFSARRAKWRGLLESFRGGDIPTILAVAGELLKGADPIAPAMIYDLLETQARNPIEGIDLARLPVRRLRAMADAAHARLLAKLPARPFSWAEALKSEPALLNDFRDPRTDALVRLVGDKVRQGKYLSHIDPDNLEFDGQDWRLLDAGNGRIYDSAEEAMDKFTRHFTSKWAAQSGNYDYADAAHPINAFLRRVREHAGLKTHPGPKPDRF